ncbi:MAG: hypothetical protein Fur0015_11330 [Ignavibacteriales bacterium]
MDAINILFGIALLYSLAANLSAARKGIKEKLTKSVYKPKTVLQKLPPNISALILVLQIAGIFDIGKFSAAINNNFMTYRIIALVGYVLFSFLQVYSFKSLGKFYSQDLVILQNHELVTNGIYKFIRHPQYLFQVLSDLCAGVVLLNYLVLPITLLVEFPLFVLRAIREEKMLENHFEKVYNDYKKRSGFMLPFIG